MSDILNTAVSGLLVAQRQLATTSHNIANAGTPGYSRQRVDLQTQDPQAINRVALGKGVIIRDIQRYFDSFTTEQVRDVTSEQSRLDMFHQLASVIDDILADSQGGITPVLQNFFSAAQDLADDPNSAAARIAMLDQASALTARFGFMDDRLNALQLDLTDRTNGTVGDINQLATALYETNQDIINSRGTALTPPPDLLDRRDELLRELSELIPIQAVEVPTGAVNVFVGQGQMLLSDTVLNSMQTSFDPSDPSLQRVYVQSANALSDITEAIGGGELGGVLDFRNGMIDDVRNGLGRMAVGIATLFNQQHRNGMDQGGNLGGDFFSVDGPQVLTNGNNTGAATASAVVSDVSALSGENYTATFDGANWTLVSDDGASSVTGAGPVLSLNGVDVIIGGGAAAAGDSFKIKPVVFGAGTFSVALTRPEDIATASPIRTSGALSNTGDAVISVGTVTDVSDADLLDPITIRFNSPATTFDILDTGTGAVLAAAQAFTSGADIDYNGWRVQISGTPQSNDTFTIEENTDGVSDNTNMLSLAALQNLGVFDSGGTSFQELYSEVVADVGSQTRFAEINRDTQAALKSTLEARRESISGVNLDEEAADLIRFQQAYQASARTITTAQEIFQSLINAF
ncbi:MAG: flagellar hook-associated protein FlgK [Pseudomonadota bacterium]